MCVYGHNLGNARIAPLPTSATISNRGFIKSKQIVVAPRNDSVDITLQLNALPDSEWEVETAASYLSDESVVPVAETTLKPAYRVGSDQNRIWPL